jgi:hypothetical protein
MLFWIMFATVLVTAAISIVATRHRRGHESF